MMPFSTIVPPQAVALVNGTTGFGETLTNGVGAGGTTVLVSGWAQLAVCILIVVLCCCCTLLCLCTSCICCTNNTEEVPGQAGVQPTSVISDKPPSYDEAQRTSRSGLPSYQEAMRRQSQISWIQITTICNPPDTRHQQTGSLTQVDIR